MRYSEETIEKVKVLLSNGLNSVEISKEINLHQVTIRNIKSILKERYYSSR